MGIQQALFAAIGSVLPGYLRAIYNTTTTVATTLRGGAISTGTIVGNASAVTVSTYTRVNVAAMAIVGGAIGFVKQIYRTTTESHTLACYGTSSDSGIIVAGTYSAGSYILRITAAGITHQYGITAAYSVWLETCVTASDGSLYVLLRGEVNNSILVRLTSTLTLSWARKYQAPTTTNYCIVTAISTNASGVVVGGDYDVTPTSHVPLLAYTNTAGTLQWSRTFGVGGVVTYSCLAVALDASNNTHALITLDTGVVFLVRINSAGTTLSTRAFTTSPPQNATRSGFCDASGAFWYIVTISATLTYLIKFSADGLTILLQRSLNFTARGSYDAAQNRIVITGLMTGASSNTGMITFSIPVDGSGTGTIVAGPFSVVYSAASVAALGTATTAATTATFSITNVTPATVTPGFTAVDTTLSTDAISIA